MCLLVLPCKGFPSASKKGERKEGRRRDKNICSHLILHFHVDHHPLPHASVQGPTCGLSFLNVLHSPRPSISLVLTDTDTDTDTGHSCCLPHSALTEAPLLSHLHAAAKGPFLNAGLTLAVQHPCMKPGMLAPPTS